MGLEIDGSSLVGAVGGPGTQDGELRLDGVAIASIPVSSNGSDRDGELAALIADVRSKLPRLPSRVRLGVGGSDTAMRLIEVPRPRRSTDFQAVIAEEAEHRIPLPLARTHWAARVQRTFSDPEGGRRATVLIAAAKRELVDPLCAAVHGAGCEVIGVDLSAFAAIRALPSRSGTWLGAVLGSQTTLFVANGRECLFTRAPGDLNDTTTRPGETASGGGLPDAVARRLVQEIHKTCQYHATLEGAVAVSHVVLTGPGADSAQLVSAVADGLDLPLSVEAPRGAHGAPTSCAAAVAAGLCVEAVA